MEWLSEGLVAAISVGIGIVISKSGDWLKNRSSSRIDEKKAHSDITSTEMEKAASIYREMLADLKKEYSEMMAHLRAIEEDHITCREENAGLKATVKINGDRISQLEKSGKGSPE